MLSSGDPEANVCLSVDLRKGLSKRADMGSSIKKSPKYVPDMSKRERRGGPSNDPWLGSHPKLEMRKKSPQEISDRSARPPKESCPKTLPGPGPF